MSGVGGRAKLARLEDDVPRIEGMAVKPLGKLAADHQAHHPRVVDLFPCELARVAPVAQHRHAVGDLFDLAESVRDVDDAHALPPQLRDRPKQQPGLAVGKAAGRFVHDEHARVG